MEQETRIAVVGIIVEDKEAVEEINRILHDYSPVSYTHLTLPTNREV